MQSILNRMFPREPLSTLPNISIIGIDDGGKTTMLHKLAYSEVITTIPLIGLNIESANIQVQAPAFGGKKQKFIARAADIGGCSKYRYAERLIMIPATLSALVWVIDANDTDRLVESLEELRFLLPKLGAGDEDIAPSIPILILINKIDLPNRQSLEKIRARFDPLLEGRRFAYFETCSTARVAASGLPEAFTWLGDAISSPAARLPGDVKPATSEAEKPIEKILADMRSPAALAAKLEEWLSRAEKDVPAEQLLHDFYALDLPEWDHYTHIRLAYILLLKFGRREGKDKIFEGFKQYIDKSGKIHGKSFHITMTYFWVQMVHLGIAGMGMDVDSHTLKGEATEKDTRLEDFGRFLMVNQYLVDGQLWADYYSKEVLMSPEAKQGVRFPDIKGLPDVLYPPAVETRRKMEGSASVSSQTTLV